MFIKVARGYDSKDIGLDDHVVLDRDFAKQKEI